VVTIVALAGVSVLAPASQLLDPAAAAARLADPLGLLATLLFILVIGPLPEEIGWRGYLLDRLQARWSALRASLTLALIWWSWHLPLFVLPGYFDAFGRGAPSPLDLLYGIVPSAILYTWVYNNTRRSVLAVIALHFMQNLTGELLGVAGDVRTLRLGLEAALALDTDRDSVLAYAPGPRMAAVLLFSQEKTARGEADMARMTQALIERVLDIGGTYYLPYRPHASLAQLVRGYPGAEAFAAAKRAADPDLVFRNRLWDDYFARL
jgi:membrane protease YdiL (CAAX protease family)